MADDFLICSFMGRCQLLYISFKKSLGSLEEKGEKLNAADPKVCSSFLDGACQHPSSVFDNSIHWWTSQMLVLML